tara:strand:- start:2853 stop:3020 length:168 start_codon:yes stop_codon:yes gene_type:complete
VFKKLGEKSLTIESLQGSAIFTNIHKKEREKNRNNPVFSLFSKSLIQGLNFSQFS